MLKELSIIYIYTPRFFAMSPRMEKVYYEAMISN